MGPWPSKVAVGVGALRAEPGASGLAAALGDKGAQRAYPAASSGDDSTNRPEDSDMMQWAVIFLVIAILAGLFGRGADPGGDLLLPWPQHHAVTMIQRLLGVPPARPVVR